jgi:endo-1,4-beta-xylanase
MMNRRSLIKSMAAICAGVIPFPAPDLAKGEEAQRRPLKEIAQRTGRLVAMYTGQHELMNDPIAAKLIATECDTIAVGNDLKMNRVRPTRDTYNFSYGDWDIDWSERNGLHFRGHTLVWHQALPAWFDSHVNQQNAQRVMTDHITTVVRHYAGRIYSWDVVNEVIHNDGRPDQLRQRPWLELIGPNYIEIAFRAAAAADPKAKLILNETNIEHDLPEHAQRRGSLLQLLTRLKNDHVPITGIGIQGHLRADTPLATAGMHSFLTAIRDLDLEILITELDVNDTGIPEPAVDEAVARKYAEFLELVAPFANVITFEQLADDASLPKRSDGLIHRPALFDTAHQKKPAYYAAAETLGGLEKYTHPVSNESF